MKTDDKRIDPGILKTLISLAIKEDIGDGDVTTEAIFDLEKQSESKIIAKDNGVFCGSTVIVEVYGAIDPNIKISLLAKDGDHVKKGDEVVVIKGSTASILRGERIVLNFIQRMSGIATKTEIFVSLVKESGISILDTRKTLPGFRMLDKYSVYCGGGTNHRIGLFDMVMIKDNHIKAAGNITEAVNRVRKMHGGKHKIEVETTTITEVEEAVKAGADIVMLDNMNREMMKESIDIINKKAKIEISGNMDRDKIREIMDLNVDYISIGALTHSVEAFDLSMKFLD